MNASNVRDMERLIELLADEAAAALDAGDALELKELLDRHPGFERDDLMEAAALAQIALLRRAQRSDAGQPSAFRMPPGLRARLASQGEAMAIRQRSLSVAPRPAQSGAGPADVPQPPARNIDPAARVTPAGRPPPRRVSPIGYAGWALAAALAVAIVVIRTDGPSIPAVTDSVAARAGFAAEAPDVVSLPWAPPSAVGYQEVTGDVLWSQSRQQGYLRLANMPVNDPARVQYQLWIVDAGREGKQPVDGGVFNVSSTGEVIIPIQAKLLIHKPKAFAITAEQPGGVVVSAGPLLVVAASES